MRRSLIILLFIFFSNLCNAQFKKHLDSLCIVCNNSRTDAEKVIALGKLANLYYTYKLTRQGDSVLHDQLLVAELSDNNELILSTLFGDAIANLSVTASTESFDNTLKFIEKGINYAKSGNQYDYIALGYSRMANVLTKRGQYEKALYNANLAIQGLPNVISDSIKAVVYIESGNAYLAKGEIVSACTNYNNAFDIALRMKSVPLQSDIYHCFSEMYHALGNDDVAIAELKKSLALNRENNYPERIIRDYYDLARITGEKFYIERSISLSDSLHSNKYLLQAKSLMFYYYMVIEKNSDKTLHYLEMEPDVKESCMNIGIGNYYRTIGQVFLYSEKPDSALYYFKLAEPDFVNYYGEKLSRALFLEMAECYEKLHQIPAAIEYYTSALTISKKMNDAKEIAPISASLSDLYEKQGNYEQAFLFSKQSIQYKDSLRNLSKARDIALLGVERENRKHDEEVRQYENKLNNKRNLQYMLISIAICVIFIGMLIMGMFPVSKVTIKMLGYFFFISLFEFIVLVIDTFLHKITHGEPLRIWLIKIFLIAMLVPFQHFLEHGLIKFLESRKLLEARTKFSLKKWFYKVKKPAPVMVAATTAPGAEAADVEAGFEKDTAVL